MRKEKNGESFIFIMKQSIGGITSKYINNKTYYNITKFIKQIKYNKLLMIKIFKTQGLSTIIINIYIFNKISIRKRLEQGDPMKFYKMTLFDVIVANMYIWGYKFNFFILTL